MTPQQMTFQEWINRTSMTSLAGLVMQAVWLIGSLVLTFVCADLLTTGPRDYFSTVPLAPSHEKFTESMTLYLAMADSYVKTAHNTGLILAGALLGAWGVKSGITTVQHGKDRNTSREKIHADSEAQIGLEEARHRLTDERPAVRVDHAEKVETNIGGQPEREQPTGDARVDDERSL